MQRIDKSAIRGGTHTGDGRFSPKAVGTVCPHCNKIVTFSLGRSEPAGPRHCSSASSACPSCNKKVGFWTVNPGGLQSTDDVELYMSPAAKMFVHDMGDLSTVPDPLRRALFGAIDAYNAGIYSAAAVSGRRALEGIFKYQVPESERKKSLNELIKIAAKQDMSAPLQQLSHAIRSGGNLGAHFDMEREPDEGVARQIVELLCYLVSYMYVLPAQIRRLEENLGKAPDRNEPGG